MKINKITGTNFKAFEEIEFEPTKTTTVLVGSNGKGKSSITEMVRYALTGIVPNDAIKAGKDALTVKLETVDLAGNNVSWERTKSLTKNSKVKVNGKISTGKALSAFIESVAGIPLETLKLASSSDLVEALKPDEFSDFIMGYIPESLDYDQIKEFMGPVDPLCYTVLENNEVIPLSGKFGYDQLQTTYNYLFEQRKLTRAALSSYEAKLQGAVTEKPGLSIADIDKRIEIILKEEGGIANALKAVESYNRLEEAKKRQEIQIKELEDKISKIEVKRPDPAEKTRLEAEKRALNDSIVSLKATIATMNNNIASFKSTIENLNKPMCPLSEGLVCKTDKTAKKAEFEEQIESNKEGIKIITAEINEKTEKYNEVLKKESQYNEQDKIYREKILLVKQLDDLKKSLIKLPAKPIAPEPGLDYTEEKKRLNEMRNTVMRYNQYIADFAKAKNLKKEKEILDSLVSMFAPKGPVALKITQHYFGVFEDAVNERAAELRPGFTLKFVADEGIHILCETNPGRGYIPYRACSSGERAFVVFLLMDLISNTLAGANILILDDLDKLDKVALEDLMKCVMQPSVQDSYDHILLCMVNHNDALDVLDKYSDLEVKTL